MELTAEQLASQSKRGDKKSFELLVKRFQRPIHTLCYRFLGNSADAYDAAQETFIRLYQKLHLYDDTQNFKPWLYRIAVNICKDAIKKRRPWEELDFSLESPQGDPLEEWEQQELQKSIEAALLQLPDKYRMVIILRHIKELEYEEIAQVLDIPVNTVKTHIRRARGLLRNLLKEVK